MTTNSTQSYSNKQIIENHNIQNLNGHAKKCDELEILSYSLTTLMGIQELSGNLKKLIINGWKSHNLITLQGIQELRSSILELEIKGVRGIQTLEQVNSLKHLKRLTLDDLESLKPSLLDINVEDLAILNCSFYPNQIIKPGKTLRSLQLTLQGETTLENILVSTKELSLKVHNLQSLKGSEFLNDQLKKLRLIGVKNTDFESLQGLEQMQNLEVLELSGFRTLKTIKEINFLGKLKQLNLNRLSLSKDVNDIEQILTINSEVNITTCNVNILQSFQFIYMLILHDVNYQDFSFLRNPVYIQHFIINNCKQFSSVKNIGQIKNLYSLKFINCNLQAFNGFEELEDQLKELSMENCCIKQLSFLFDLQQLTYLNINKNEILTTDQLLFIKYLSRLKTLNICENPVIKKQDFEEKLLQYLQPSINNVFFVKSENYINEKIKKKIIATQQKHQKEIQNNNNHQLNQILLLEQILTNKVNQNKTLLKQVKQKNEDLKQMKSHFENYIYELNLQGNEQINNVLQKNYEDDQISQSTYNYNATAQLVVQQQQQYSNQINTNAETSANSNVPVMQYQIVPDQNQLELTQRMSKTWKEWGGDQWGEDSSWDQGGFGTDGAWQSDATNWGDSQQTGWMK